MSGLGSALRELAAAAEPPAPAEPALLWDTGRRRVRRRRIAGAAVALGVIAAALSAAVVIPPPVVVMPAATTHAAAVPQNVYTPSRWLQNTSQAGPLGRLAVVGWSEYRHSAVGVFGISATTGQYRFLDLPGRLTLSPVALSPDGRHVAYWIKGPVTGRAFADDLYDPRVDGPQPIAGYAVYDSVTGSVVRHLVASTHGLRPVDRPLGQGLLWRNDTELVATYGQIIDANHAEPAVTDAWAVGSASPHRISGPSTPARIYTYPDGTLVGIGGNSNGTTNVLYRLGDHLAPTGAGLRLAAGEVDDVSRVGNRLVVIGRLGGRGAQRVFAGTVPAHGGTVATRSFDSVVLTRLLGWTSDHTVLVTGLDGAPVNGAPGIAGELTGRPTLRPALYQFDLRTHRVHKIGSSSQDGYNLWVATDLLTSPLVQGIRPPSDPHRHLLEYAGAGAALVLLAGGVLWLWRRRA